MDSSIEEIVPVFLTDLLPPEEKKLPKNGKKNGKPQNWDTRKQYTTQVQIILNEGGLKHRKLSARVKECANTLNFGWVSASDGINELKFKSAYFCRVRTCPVCQWRRSQMLLARFFEAYPRIKADYPKIRFVFLTLTIANCPVNELKDTIKAMNEAWNRLTKRRTFPAIGFIRSLEVTRAKDGKAHPHFHVLLALEPSYFTGRNYLSTEKWAAMWQESLRVDYTPVCDIRIVKAKNATTGDSEQSESIKAAIVEVLKYTVKPADMVKDSTFLLELVNQLHKVRAVSLGGIFKQYMQDVEADEEVELTEQPENTGGLYFGWRPPVKRYQLKT